VQVYRLINNAAGKSSGEETVKPSSVAYAKALSIADAVALLDKHGGDARIIAGGPEPHHPPQYAAQRPRRPGRHQRHSREGVISLESDHLRISALVRYTDALESDLIARHAPLLAKALPHVAHPAIRNAERWADRWPWPIRRRKCRPACWRWTAWWRLTGPDGSRRIAAANFFLGLYETALTPNEVLTAILLPLPRPDSRFAFAEIARRHGNYALVGLAASARSTGAGLADVRLAYFSVGATPIRPRTAELAFEGSASTVSAVDAAIAALRQELEPVGDLQASPKLKLHLAGELLRRVAADLHGEEA
jgi:carbon-monoxide dehydrogenase medium subunit